MLIEGGVDFMSVLTAHEILDPTIKAFDEYCGIPHLTEIGKVRSKDDITAENGELLLNGMRGIIDLKPSRSTDRLCTEWARCSMKS